RRAGHLRVRGGDRLSGRIVAESFRVEPGAEVEIEAGTTIYSLGDVRIDAPLREVAPIRPKRSLLPGAVRDAGADVPDLVVICENGDYTQTQILLLVDGGDGACVAGPGTQGLGGAGGKGGGIRIECPGTVTIMANVVPGRGGKGGCADITGRDGAPGAN